MMSKSFAQRIIMSLNIRYDNPSDGVNAWEHRKEAVANWIGDSIVPDIICLQEVLSHQLSYLNQHWSSRYDYYGVGREDGNQKGEFSPIFFLKDRYKQVNAQTIWLSPTSDQPSKGWDAACERILTILRLYDKQSGDTLSIMNTHWDHVGKTARIKSAEILLNQFKQISKEDLFFCAGDFNAALTSEELQMLNQHWRDLTPPANLVTPTFNGFKEEDNKYEHIDFIWTHSANLDHYQYFQRRSLNNLPFISDHDAIWVVETE